MTTAKKEYRIETRAGFYSAHERIGSHTFPERLGASFQGATVYRTRKGALSQVNRLRAAGHVADLHEISQ